MRKEVPAHTIYTCDRCGIATGEPSLLKDWRVLERRHCTCNGILGLLQTSDLCPNCVDSHRDWLETYKVKAAPLPVAVPHDDGTRDYGE